MTPTERQNLKKLDDLILNASPEELKKIQDVDSRTQMEGISFYDVYVDYRPMVNHNIKKSSK